MPATRRLEREMGRWCRVCEAQECESAYGAPVCGSCRAAADDAPLEALDRLVLGQKRFSSELRMTLKEWESAYRAAWAAVRKSAAGV